MIEKLKQLDTSQFSYGYCHYDFFPKNFHLDESNQITFFDFDFAGKGFLINDLLSFYIHYFLEVTYNKISREAGDRSFAVFLKSYRQTRKISAAEMEALPYLGFAFWIFYMGFHYENFDDWSNIFFTTKFIKDRVALIKKWMDFDAEFSV